MNNANMTTGYSVSWEEIEHGEIFKSLCKSIAQICTFDENKILRTSYM